MSNIQNSSRNPSGTTPATKPQGAPETATEEVDRKDAALPHGGLSPEYDEAESDIEKEGPARKRTPD